MADINFLYQKLGVSYKAEVTGQGYL